MSSAVKIVKRGERERKNLRSARQEETGQQARREIISTVKSWIVELEQRRRAEERTYALLRK